MEKMIDVSQEQKEYAIDLLVTLVVEELEKFHKPAECIRSIENRRAVI